MEQVQQTIRAQEPEVWQGLQRNAQANPGGDAFLAVFQHMMEAMDGEETSLLTPEDGQTETEPDRNALAMMGELAGMGLMPAAAQPRQEVEAAESGGVAAIGPQAEDPRQTKTVRPAEEVPTKDAGADQTRTAWRELPEVPIVEAGYTQRPTAEPGGAEYRAQGAFRTAVETARRQLNAPEEPEKKTATAGAETAAQTEFRPHMEAAAPEKTERTEEPEPLTRQLDKGISEQLELGKKEFTLKLKPASLGEITVRLVEKEGKTTLSIVTASSETAKTINSDLAALREAVRPMAVEVHEAVPRAPENAQSQSFGMMGEQQFQQFQQQQQRQSFHRAPRTGGLPLMEAVSETERRFRAPVAAGLDTYV